MQKVAVTSVAVATMKFPFGMCDWTVDSNICRGDFCRCWRFARVWIRTRAIARVSGHGLP